MWLDMMLLDVVQLTLHDFNSTLTWHCIDSRVQSGMTILMLAAVRGNIALVRLLVEHGADVWVTDNVSTQLYRIKSYRFTSHWISLYYITSHYVSSHHITSHHIILHHIILHHITSHHIALHHQFQFMRQHNLQHGIPCHTVISQKIHKPHSFNHNPLLNLSHCSQEGETALDKSNGSEVSSYLKTV